MPSTLKSHGLCVAAYAAHNVDITDGEGTGARLRKSPTLTTSLTDGEAGIVDNNKT
jgi:hypothetical protein